MIKNLTLDQMNPAHADPWLLIFMTTFFAWVIVLLWAASKK